mgnify:FL=1
MPFSYQYIIEKDKFDKRLLSELQHKIRVPLKCYTVSEFKLNEDNSFEFKKTNRKMIGGNKITITDKKVHHGSFLKEELSDTIYRITLTFYD